METIYFLLILLEMQGVLNQNYEIPCRYLYSQNTLNISQAHVS